MYVIINLRTLNFQRLFQNATIRHQKLVVDNPNPSNDHFFKTKMVFVSITFFYKNGFCIKKFWSFPRITYQEANKKNRKNWQKISSSVPRQLNVKLVSDQNLTSDNKAGNTWPDNIEHWAKKMFCTGVPWIIIDYFVILKSVSIRLQKESIIIHQKWIIVLVFFISV